MAALTFAAPVAGQAAAEYGAVAAKGAAAAAAAKAPAPKKDAPATPARAAPDRKAVPSRATEPAPSAPSCAGDLPPPVSVSVVTGKSTLLKLPEPITLRTLGDDDVAQARLIGPQTLYLLGVGTGSTNMILQDASGRCTIVDVGVAMDTGALQAKFAQLMPEEKAIRVAAAADTLVLSGVVSDATKVDFAVMLANAYVRKAVDKDESKGRASTQDQAGRGELPLGRQSPRVVNMLSVAAPQQVLLEVKVAEVSKKLLDKLGASLNLNATGGNWTYSILTDFLTGGAGVLDMFRKLTGEFVTIDGENKDGLVKILAEPNLMAISGQEGSFLAGGKVYFPVAQGSSSVGVLGAATVPITLYEQEFGVALKFTPTVLEGGRINLRVAPEVSELSPEGIAIQAVNAAGRTIAPLITTRRASTTVQLYDGQTFAIGGLIKNNAATDIKAFPLLGQIPIIGALFRSTAFQTDKSELLFVVTPHLVKPMVGAVRLPTDSYREPNWFELFLGGKMEGSPPEPAPGTVVAPAPAVPDAPKAPSGFEVK